MSEYVIAIEGLAELKDIEHLDEQIARAARIAINRAADRARTRSAKDIREQIAFPARYLNERLTVTKRAADRSLEAVVTGRDRPTSLARFAKDRNVANSRKRKGVNVTVTPGQTLFMAGAFLMQLRGGNLGLAVRLKDGESIRNKKAVRKIGAGLYLLFGPSIDQVFRTVSQDQAPETAEDLEREFLRIMDLD